MVQQGKATEKGESKQDIEGYLTIRPVALSGYGPITDEAKLSGLLTCGP